MFAIAYLSHATVAFDDAALALLAERSSAKNERLAITGYLSFDAQRNAFFQFLEGSREEVRQLMDQILDDPRHEIVNFAFLDETEDRLFPSWNMRYLPTEFFQAMQMEGVLERLLTTMGQDAFDRDMVGGMVTRFTTAIAARMSA